MKTIWKYMTLAAAAAFMAACQPTYPEIIPGDVPQASSLDVTITPTAFPSVSGMPASIPWR